MDPAPIFPSVVAVSACNSVLLILLFHIPTVYQKMRAMEGTKEIDLVSVYHSAERTPTSSQDTVYVKMNTISLMEIVKNVRITKFTIIKRKNVNLFVDSMQHTIKLTQSATAMKVTMCCLMAKRSIVADVRMMKIMMEIHFPALVHAMQTNKNLTKNVNAKMVFIE